MDKKSIDEEIHEIVQANPGITGAGIYRIRLARSRAAKWFGVDSVLAILFGPSIAGVYPILMRLEMRGRIRSDWLPRKGDSPYRQRGYWTI